MNGIIIHQDDSEVVRLDNTAPDTWEVWTLEDAGWEPQGTINTKRAHEMLAGVLDGLDTTTGITQRKRQADREEALERWQSRKANA